MSTNREASARATREGKAAARRSIDVERWNAAESAGDELARALGLAPKGKR
jgi:hypothetical protein